MCNLSTYNIQKDADRQLDTRRDTDKQSDEHVIDCHTDIYFVPRALSDWMYQYVKSV